MVAMLTLATTVGLIVTVAIPVIKWWNNLPMNLRGQRRWRGRWIGRAR